MPATMTDEKTTDAEDSTEDSFSMPLGDAAQITVVAIREKADVSRNKRTLDGLIRGGWIEPRAEVDPEVSRSAKDYKLTSKGSKLLKDAAEADFDLPDVPEPKE
jgi:hypothetical protein